MIYFSVICAGLFLITLLLLAFWQKYVDVLRAVLIAAGAGTLIGAIWWLLQLFTKDILEFLHPWVFILLVIPVLVFWAYTAGRSVFARTIHYPLTHLKTEQASLRVLFTRWLPAALYTLSLILMITALARPTQINRTALPPTEGIDIMLLMDVSASMNKQDFYPSRFIAAQSNALQFVKKRLNDRIGVTVFAKESLLQAPLTLDHEALEDYISSLYLGIVYPELTAIGDGLAVAINHLKDSKAKSKIIILLTDGDSNFGTVEPLMAAKAAATYGIKVYTIGTASAPGQNPYSSAEDEINEGLLMEIAQMTGGQFYRAKNEAELEKIYDTINELEKTEFSSSSVIHRTDEYQPLLLAAVYLLLLGLMLEKILFVKVP